MKQYILARLAEASTWRGILAVITAAGISISPAQMAAITSLGLAAMGLVGAFFPDSTKG